MNEINSHYLSSLSYEQAYIQLHNIVVRFLNEHPSYPADKYMFLLSFIKEHSQEVYPENISPATFNKLIVFLLKVSDKPEDLLKELKKYKAKQFIHHMMQCSSNDIRISRALRIIEQNK